MLLLTAHFLRKLKIKHVVELQPLRLFSSRAWSRTILLICETKMYSGVTIPARNLIVEQLQRLLDKLSLPGKNNHDRAARKGQPRQHSQELTVSTDLLGKGS
jgi:hypothetical protein